MAKYIFSRIKTAVRRVLKDNAIVNLRMRQLYLSAYELLLLCIPYKQAIRATSRSLWRITAMPAEIVMLAGSAMTERAKMRRNLRTNYFWQRERIHPNMAREFLAWVSGICVKSGGCGSATLHLTVFSEADISGTEENSLFGILCMHQSAPNFHLLSGKQDPAGQLGPLLTSEERRIVTRGGSLFDQLPQAQLSLADSAALLHIPEPAHAAARRYLSQFSRYHPIIATSIGDDPVHADAKGNAKWIPLFEAIHERHPEALIVVLNSTGVAATDRYPHHIRLLNDVGFGFSEALAIAQQSGVYIGMLDVFGAMAWSAGRTGVYFSANDATQRNPHALAVDCQILLTEAATFVEGMEAIEQVLPRYLRRFMNPMEGSAVDSPSAHEFIKLWDQRDVVVALNFASRVSQMNPAELRYAIDIVNQIVHECPHAVICLLNPLTNESALHAGPQIWTTASFGSSRDDLLTLARSADLYCGVLDDFGHTAFLEGRPGIYAAELSVDRSSSGMSTRRPQIIEFAQKMQLICDYLEPELCASALRQLMQTRQARQRRLIEQAANTTS